MSQTLPKYTLHCVDTSDESMVSTPTVAAIIVPQGRERDSVYSTELGRQNLCKQAKVARIVLILMGHGHVFENVDVVKNELNSKILELAPDNCQNYKSIPIMTAGPDIGTKSILDMSADNINGIIVQDVKTDDNKVRQAIF